MSTSGAAASPDSFRRCALRLVKGISEIRRPCGHFRSKHLTGKMLSDRDLIVNRTKCFTLGPTIGVVLQRDEPSAASVAAGGNPISLLNQAGRRSSRHRSPSDLGRSGTG